MKKLFLSILAVIYLTVASGMSVHLHYCMGKLVSWSLNQHQNKCTYCSKEKEHSSNVVCRSCCKDEQKLVKLNTDYKAERMIQPDFFFGKAARIAYPVEFTIYNPEKILGCNSIHASPQKHKVAIYLFNCVFRI
jgi:hypothetical protein